MKGSEGVEEMDIHFFDKVKSEIVGHLPGYYDSRKLLYDIIANSEPCPGSVHVEIGTLSGGGTIFMMEALRKKKALDTEKIVCVDPFSGFYEKEDPTVSIETVKKNLEKFDFDPDNVIFVPRISQDIEAVRMVKSMTVNTVFVDGDHTYEGVKKDWENYSRLVMKNGYVIFDDYVGEEKGRPIGSENPDWRKTSWGQVSRYVDLLVMPKLGKYGYVFCQKSTNAIAFKKNVRRKLFFGV
jgi:predicted O-methyltransferase YrrM